MNTVFFNFFLLRMFLFFSNRIKLMIVNQIMTERGMRTSSYMTPGTI